MKIRELTVSNYRAFGEETFFSFADRFTVIAGVNGRGKTAVLDGLALVLSRLLSSLRLAGKDHRTVTPADVHGQADSTTLSMKVNCAGIPLEYRVSYKKKTNRATATRLSAVIREQVVKKYGDPNRDDDQAPLAVYYTTDRAGFRLPKTLPSTLPKEQEAAYTGALLNRMVDYRDFMARYQVWLTEGSHRTLRALNAALHVFLDDFSDLVVDRSPLSLSVRKGEHRLILSQLSDGERSFLAIIGDLVRRLSIANPALSDPLQGAGVVLIDELELHLHPQWQRNVVENLRKVFPKIQFVATTHSPFIIQTLRSDELILLDDIVIGSFANRGLEEIASKVMGVTSPDVSPRYLEMLDAARKYFTTLESSSKKTGAQRAALKRKLNRLVRPYADNPAYQALLELERIKTLKE